MAHLTAQTSADQQFAREWAEARVGAFDNSFAARYAELRAKKIGRAHV